MDASAFWDVIGEYNQKTFYWQTGLLIFLAAVTIYCIRCKKGFTLKLALGLVNLFIAFGFFFTFGTQAIQKYFAFPLFLLTGLLFAYEALRNKDDILNQPQAIHCAFFALYLLYPLVSIALGNSWPKMVTHIMPCPVATISLALYSLYNKKNRALLILLTIWGLTGVKSVIFAAYEDTILLAAGIFGVILLTKEFRTGSIKVTNLSEIIPFDRTGQEAVIKCSICTGEQIAGFKNKADGKFREVMVIKSNDDLEYFKNEYRIDEIRKEY